MHSVLSAMRTQLVQERRQRIAKSYNCQELKEVLIGMEHSSPLKAWMHQAMSHFVARRIEGRSRCMVRPV